MKKWFILIMCISFQLPGFASDNGGAFIREGLSARSAGLGKAIVAGVNDSEAVYWNPAALTTLGSSAISLTNAFLFETQYNALFYSFHQGEWSLGVGGILAQTNDIKSTIIDPAIKTRTQVTATGETFSYQGLGVYLSAAKPVTNALDLGVSLKLLRESLFNNHGFGYGLDLGARYRPIENWSLGVNFQNILSPRMKWDTPDKAVDTVPLVVKTGVAYDRYPFTVEGDMSYQKGRALSFNFGSEWHLVPEIPLRVGLDNFTLKERSVDLSIGAGLIVNDLHLDLSWTKPSNSVISDIYRLSVSYVWR